MRERVQGFVDERGEEGHAPVAGAALLSGIGAVLLGIGSAADTGWLAIVGGIVAGVGFVGYELLRHTKIDYELFRRTNPK
ncbi:MAG: hypothetical protein ACKVT1_14625 [Dehalococcoidia bacterium]